MRTQKSDSNPRTTFTEKIPANISAYIKKYFRDSFLLEIKSFKDRKGEQQFYIDISEDNTLYHLKFNTGGVLTQKETEPLLELHDEDNYTEID